MTTKEMIIHKSSFSSVASLPLKSASLALCLQPSFLPLIKELSVKEILNPWPMPYPRFLVFFFLDLHGLSEEHKPLQTAKGEVLSRCPMI